MILVYMLLPNNITKFFILLVALLMVFLFNIRIYSLNTYIADLGFFLSNSFATIDQPERIFYTHFQPLLLLLSYIYNLIGLKSYINLLLFFNFIIIYASAIFIYREYGRIAVLIFFLYTPLWILFLYDYHLDVLLIPIFILYYHCLKTNNIKLLLISSILFLLVKEPYILLSITTVLFYIYKNYHKLSNKTIIFLFVISTLFLFLFFYILFYLIPKFSNNTFSGLSGDGFSYILNVLSYDYNNINFKYLIYEKLKTFIILFGSLIFIPLLKPVNLIPILPILFLTLFSFSLSQSSYISHYNSAIIITLLYSTFNSSYFIKYKNIRFLILFSTFFLNLFFGVIPFGRFYFDDRHYDFNSMRYITSESTIKNFNAMNNLIPNDVNLKLSIQNNINNINLTKRFDIWLFPAGIKYTHKTLNPDVNIPFLNRSNNLIKDLYADYAIVDLDKPYFYFDKGCNWFHGECKDKQIIELYEETIDFLNKNFLLIYKNNGFMIFKRITNEF